MNIAGKVPVVKKTCPVCGGEAFSIRKHANGKWNNIPEDFEHLRLAIELTPGALAFLGENLGKEVASGRKEGGNPMSEVLGKVLD